jgi:hypothetical protein
VVVIVSCFADNSDSTTYRAESKSTSMNRGIPRQTSVMRRTTPRQHTYPLACPHSVQQPSYLGSYVAGTTLEAAILEIMRSRRCQPCPARWCETMGLHQPFFGTLLHALVHSIYIRLIPYFYSPAGSAHVVTRSRAIAAWLICEEGAMEAT